MSTNLQVVSDIVRASAVLTASHVAGPVYTFTKDPENFSVVITYTRSAGVAGFAEMLVEVSPDKTTWYQYTERGAATISAPNATIPIYLGLYTLPAPASDTAINFVVPFTPDGGMPHYRFSFREASGLAFGVLAASIHVTQEVN